MFQYLRSVRPMSCIFKTLTLIVGALTLALGGYAYFNSTWTKIYSDLKTEIDHFKAPPQFPDLFLETATLFLLSLCFLISAIDLIFDIAKGLEFSSKGATLSDLVFHIIGSLTNFIAAGLIFSSVLKIRQFEAYMKETNETEFFKGNEVQLFDLKIAAGACCIINGILYAITAGIIRSYLIPEPSILEMNVESEPSTPTASIKSTKIPISKSEHKQIMLHIKQLMRNKNSKS